MVYSLVVVERVANTLEYLAKISQDDEMDLVELHENIQV
jgi:hypothetical protein